MIAEEFILAAVLLLTAVAAQWPELVLAIIIAHSAHLVAHLVDAARTRRWVPGAVTAAATLPILGLLAWWFAADTPLDPRWVIVDTIMVGGALIADLRLMHRIAPRLNAWVARAYG